MQATSQAFIVSKAGLSPAFDRLRGCFFLAFFFVANAVPSLAIADQEFSFSDLERLVETCIEQTDVNFENRPALPVRTDSAKFSEVHIEDAGKFEEATKLRIAQFYVGKIFEPDTPEENRQKTVESIPGVLQNEPARQNHHEVVLRQIGNHALWKSPDPANGEWNNFGIVGGSAWWYSQDVAIVWKGSVLSGTVCQIYGVPSPTARRLVGNSNWSFEKESNGPIARYVATQNAITPVPRTLVRLLTGLGKTHSLPAARIEVIEIEPGFLTEDSSGEWFIVISDSRYHDLL